MDEKKSLTFEAFMEKMYGVKPKGLTDEERVHLRKLIAESIPQERRQNGQEGTLQNDR